MADPNPQNPPQAGAIVDAHGVPIEFLNDVSLELCVELGRNQTSIRDLLTLDKGAVFEVQKLAGEPLDIRLNGKLVARGEIVVVNEKFGVRVTEILTPEDFSTDLGAPQPTTKG